MTTTDFDANPAATTDSAASLPPTDPGTTTTPNDDDFSDVEMGKRQADACSMDEGCTACQ